MVQQYDSSGIKKRPSLDYDGMRQASKFRAQFDWLVGMNFTRAASAKLYQFVPIGRVQSPVLKLIVDREREIQVRHVPK